MLERHVGVQAASDCAMDYGLALLVQQLDEALFGADGALDALVGAVEVAHDGSLFGYGWTKQGYSQELIRIQAES